MYVFNIHCRCVYVCVCMCMCVYAYVCVLTSERVPQVREVDNALISLRFPHVELQSLRYDTRHDSY